MAKQLEEDVSVPGKISLAKKIEQAREDTNYKDFIAEDLPTSPSAVPGSRARGRKARLGTIVNKTPFV